ncbi:ATP-binding cassette domain-containing protein [Streptomyces venezuelae]
MRKAYGDWTVLDGVDLAVPDGTVFALLGPNGAGKTTAVKILSTLASPGPGSGAVRVGGFDLVGEPQAVRAVIGVTGQLSAIDGLLTGEENMRLMADLRHLTHREGRRVAAELLERFDLVEAAGKPAGGYSGGMRRRLDIAMTLVGGPRIIFLDEPTTGLDPRSRHTMWGVVRELVADGVTVFLTTQYLEEADQLADRIAVLHDGKIAAEGSANELKRLVPGGHVRLRFDDPGAFRSASAALRDSSPMLCRNLLHVRRYPSLTLNVLRRPTPPRGAVRRGGGRVRIPRAAASPRRGGPPWPAGRRVRPPCRGRVRAGRTAPPT